MPKEGDLAAGPSAEGRELAVVSDGFGFTIECGV